MGIGLPRASNAMRPVRVWYGALNGFDSNMTFLQKRIRETITKVFPDD
jgi:hypothetical protein